MSSKTSIPPLIESDSMLFIYVIPEINLKVRMYCLYRVFTEKVRLIELKFMFFMVRPAIYKLTSILLNREKIKTIFPNLHNNP